MVGRLVGVVTVEVVVLVPAPALRRVVIVAVVTGRGLGRLVVVVGRVRVDVVWGRWRVEVEEPWWWQGRCQCLPPGVT